MRTFGSSRPAPMVRLPRPRAFPATPGNWSAGSMACSAPAPSPTNRCRPSSTASRCACFSSASSRAGPADPANSSDGRDILRSHYEMIVDRSAGLALGQEVPLGTHGHKFTVVGLMRQRGHVVRRSGRLHHLARRASAAVRTCSAGRAARSRRAEAPRTATIRSTPSSPRCRPMFRSMRSPLRFRAGNTSRRSRRTSRKRC